MIIEFECDCFKLGWYYKGVQFYVGYIELIFNLCCICLIKFLILKVSDNLNKKLFGESIYDIIKDIGVLIGYLMILSIIVNFLKI